jgi:hypothetical protein
MTMITSFQARGSMNVVFQGERRRRRKQVHREMREKRLNKSKEKLQFFCRDRQEL